MDKTKVFLGFVLIGLLVVSAASIPLQAAIPAEERAALIALYNGTNGDSWKNNGGWKTPPLHTDGFAMPGTEGTWHGITVSSDHVTQIDLGYNNLSGSIPSELGNLSNLESIFLSSNQLSGSIPAELGNLSSLETLWLPSNQLNGCIPAELGNLCNLKYLYLAENQLSGSIPAELGNLENLLHLIITKNRLSGSIPKELGNLSNLEYLASSLNRLSGNVPPELGNLSKLGALCLNDNQLCGSIPTELGNLSNLRMLLLNSNRLIGIIPSSLTNLTLLKPYEESTDISYNCLYTYDDKLRTFLNSKDSDWERNQTIAPSDVSAVAITNSSARVSWKPITYTSYTGGYKVYYSNKSGGPYTYSGMTVDKSTAFYEVAGLFPATTYYFVIKTQTNPPYPIDYTLISEYSAEVSATTGSLDEKDLPFGSFDTPIDGSTVCSNIPVTGWALDNNGIDSVKIYLYREKLIKELIYIGDAVLVEGARPDVAAAYPGYPNNTKAGWGYMMLTNFLPNSGNGTFVIHAIATDLEGKTTTLGTRTIHCDNAKSVKPFGTIDTPDQGGTASGSSFTNWGWVLTPKPNILPTDGSAINVYVDGVNLGHPTYNIYRSDIATLFPGYANSNGAAGYFHLDTTAYKNGVHTIQWAVRDNIGNSDGIGSRYFSISNTGRSSSIKKSFQANAKPQAPILNIYQITHIPIDHSAKIRVKKGFREDTEFQYIHADEKGMHRINIKEVERVQIHLTDPGDKNSNDKSLSPSCFTGHLEVNNRLEPLPVGSNLDTKRGIFYWQPGPGFIGEYRFVFIEKERNTDINRKNIVVKIVPRSQ